MRQQRQMQTLLEALRQVPADQRTDAIEQALKRLEEVRKPYSVDDLKRDINNAIDLWVKRSSQDESLEERYRPDLANFDRFNVAYIIDTVISEIFEGDEFSRLSSGRPFLADPGKDAARAREANLVDDEIPF